MDGSIVFEKACTYVDFYHTSHTFSLLMDVYTFRLDFLRMSRLFIKIFIGEKEVA